MSAMPMTTVPKNNTEQAVGVALQHFKDKWTHTAHMNLVNNPSGKKGDGFELIGAIDRDISKKCLCRHGYHLW